MTTDSTSTGPSADAGPPWEVVEPAATEQAAGAAPSTSLVVFDSIEKTIADIETRHKNVVYDLTTTKGNEAARKARKELVSARTAADEAYKTWNQPILAAQKKGRDLRDGFAKRIELLEKPLDEMIKADEDRRAAEKKAKDEAEAARTKAIRDRISDIYAQPAACAGQASGEIELSIVGVEVLMTDKVFYQELQDEAKAAADVVLTKLRAMMSAAKASEDLAKAQRLEAERLAAERAELERQRAELAAQQEAARKAAEAAEANRLAAIAQQEEERRILSERIQAEERQRAEVAATAERERLETIAREERIAREAREAAEREAAERLAEQQRQLDEQRAQFESEQAAARAAKDAEAFGVATGIDSPEVTDSKNASMRARIDAMPVASPGAPALNRVEHTSESGATIVHYTNTTKSGPVGAWIAGYKACGQTVGDSAKDDFRLACASAVTDEEPKPPVTVQTDAFEAERQAEATRAAALPKPPVKRPEDERLTAAVAKVFEVETAIAAEWLGTYDALEEIARLQGVPA